MGGGPSSPRLSPAEIEARADLHYRRNQIMDQVIAVIARDLGYGDVASMTPDQRDAVEGEAEDAEERWSRDAEIADPAIEPRTPLQRLLKRYHDFGQAMLDLSEAVARRHGSI
jgi:hypothetical protein